MRRAILQSLGVALAVAAASRLGEWSCSHLPVCGGLTQDLIGMSIAGVTAGLLFYFLRYQQRERIRLLRERERAIRHIHHHIRNSLQVVVYRCQNDPVVIQQVDRILREVQYALPGKDKYMPEDPASAEANSDKVEPS